MHLPYKPCPVAVFGAIGIYNIAIAISHAEGAWVPGSLPNRHNNPCDLMANGQVRAFRTTDQGWYEAMDFIFGWFAGWNPDITPSLTWAQMAAIYVNGPNAPPTTPAPDGWVKTVTEYLGVQPTDKLSVYITV